VFDIKEEICLCFIDWQKAFDHVDWTKLPEMLRNIGDNCREHQLIRNMGQRVKLRLNQRETDSMGIWRGVRQGYSKSIILFNLYGEYLMKEALVEIGDFKNGGRIINKVKF
jgi:Reverse transcriptase (RNA-dependent DNA polymerase).